MEEKIKYYQPMIDFISKSLTSPSYNSMGVKTGVALNKERVKLVSDLSKVLGKMDACIIYDDEKNFDLLAKLFKRICEDNDIDLSEYESWLNDQED